MAHSDLNPFWPVTQSTHLATSNKIQMQISYNAGVVCRNLTEFTIKASKDLLDWFVTYQDISGTMSKITKGALSFTLSPASMKSNSI